MTSLLGQVVSKTAWPLGVVLKMAERLWIDLVCLVALEVGM